MEIPNCLPDLIADEAHDTMKYANLAAMHRGEHPDLGEMFMKLSGEELHHMQMLADKMAGMVDKDR